MNLRRNILYKFDAYVAEAREMRLWRDGELVSLTPKAFETLIVLLENRGRVVEKDVLLEKIWGDIFVGEATLAQNISTLRKILGLNSHNQQFIETVPRHGYRFISPVEEIINDEEFVVVNRTLRTQITTEHEHAADDALTVKAETGIETGSTRLPQKLFQWVNINKTKVAVTGSFLAAAAIIFLSFNAFHTKSFSAVKFKKFSQFRVTSSGNIRTMTLSPDGKSLAMVEKQGENQSLVLRQIDNSATIEIVPPKKQTFTGLTFSPDNKQIYYTVYNQENPVKKTLVGQLFRVGILGGISQEIISDIDSPITISPDGRQFAFIRNYLEEKESALIVTGFDDPTAEKKIAVRALSDSLPFAGLSWSPDGKLIVFTASDNNLPANAKFGIRAVNIQSGEQNFLSNTKWQWIGAMSWLPDGSGIVFTAFSSQSGNHTDEVWMITYPNGAARQVTDGINGALGLSLSADSNSIAVVKSTRMTGFWIAPMDNPGQATRLTQNISEYNTTDPGISWPANNRILYGLTFNGNLDLWQMDSQGQARQLTSDKAAEFDPVETTDGKFIVFISNHNGHQNLWRMTADGTDQVQLIDEPNVFSLSLTPDNQTVFYSSQDSKLNQPVLRKISLNGGQSTQLTFVPTILPKLSPDGKLIACYYPEVLSDAAVGRNLKLTLLSAENYQVIKQFETANQANLSSLVWDAGSKNIIYSISVTNNTGLMAQPVDGGKPRILLDAAPDSVFRYAISPDGRQIVYEKGNAVNDVVLLNNADF